MGCTHTMSVHACQLFGFQVNRLKSLGKNCAIVKTFLIDVIEIASYESNRGLVNLALLLGFYTPASVCMCFSANRLNPFHSMNDCLTPLTL